MRKNIDQSEFNLLGEMLYSAFSEMKDMSKKAPNEQLKSVKIKALNRILSRIKELLSNEPSTDFLDLLEEDDLPCNSDTVLIMSQYAAAMTDFYKRNSGIGKMSNLRYMNYK